MQTCTTCHETKPDEDFRTQYPGEKPKPRQCKLCLSMYAASLTAAYKKRNEGRVWPEDFTKVCTKCKRVWPAAGYTKNSTRLDGLDIYCKECQKDARKARRNAIPPPGRAYCILSVIEVYDVYYKKCGLCQEWVERDRFQVSRRAPGGWGLRCLPCQRIRARERYRDDKDRSSKTSWQPYRSGADTPAIHWTAIFNRDGGLCCLCNKPVDKSLVNYSDGPKAHKIIPRSKGGKDEPDNVKLAHVKCSKEASFRL